MEHYGHNPDPLAVEQAYWDTHLMTPEETGHNPLHHADDSFSHSPRIHDYPTHHDFETHDTHDLTDSYAHHDLHDLHDLHHLDDSHDHSLGWEPSLDVHHAVRAPHPEHLPEHIPFPPEPE